MRKKLINFVFVGIAIAGLSTITSCKKGENDPTLSLKSRKARITGEWKLESGTLTSSSTFGGSTSSYITTYTSSTRSSNGTTSTYSETLTIDKDGTYEVAIVEDGLATTVTGNWFFVGKIKDVDIKNKEAIMFVAQQYSEPGYVETYDGLYGGEIMIMDQLKNKEVVFKGSFTSSSTGYNGSNSYERTFEKQ